MADPNVSTPAGTARGRVRREPLTRLLVAIAFLSSGVLLAAFAIANWRHSTGDPVPDRREPAGPRASTPPGGAADSAGAPTP
jgi:hypothetical protein